MPSAVIRSHEGTEVMVSAPSEDYEDAIVMTLRVLRGEVPLDPEIGAAHED